jgi:hypothetical protein
MKAITPLIGLTLITSLTSSSLWADQHEHRQEGAHVHGVAHLDLAIEGDEVVLEFKSPAANIVGFEHQPSTPEQEKKVEQAAQTLKAGDQLFRFSPKAQCHLSKAHVHSALIKEDKHEHDDEHAHEHDEHKHEKHEHKGEHDHQHADMGAHYHFHCAHPKALTQVTIKLFEHFPATEKLHVQMISDKGQKGAELTAKQPNLDL